MHDFSLQFVWIVGDSHLRPFVQSDLFFEDTSVTFGISCTPGAQAKHLKNQLNEDRNTLMEEHRCKGLNSTMLCF